MILVKWEVKVDGEPKLGKGWEPESLEERDGKAMGSQ